MKITINTVDGKTFDTEGDEYSLQTMLTQMDLTDFIVIEKNLVRQLIKQAAIASIIIERGVTK